MSRPRLVVPGTLELSPTFVGREHEILLGDLAGYLLGEDVTDWKGSYTFVALEDLSLEDRRRFAPHLADEWAAIAGDAPAGYRDAGVGARRPHLVRLLRDAHLLLVHDARGYLDPGPARRVDRSRPHRLVEVGFTRNADDAFALIVMRGGLRRAFVCGALDAIRASLDPAEPEGARADRLLDRVMRAATSGLVDSRQLSMAFWIARVADVDGWEAHLAALAARAAPHGVLAGDVARLLQDAPADRDTIALPVYGEARRTCLPACVLRTTSGGEGLYANVKVDDRRELALPAEIVWTVAEVDEDPVPTPSPRIFHAVTPHDRRRALRRRRDAVGLLVLVVLVVLGLVAFARCGGRHGPRPRGSAPAPRDLAVRAPS